MVRPSAFASPQAADLLDRIVVGPLILASDLPSPTEAERKPPQADKSLTAYASGVGIGTLPGWWVSTTTPRRGNLRLSPSPQVAG